MKRPPLSGGLPLTMRAADLIDARALGAPRDCGANSSSPSAVCVSAYCNRGKIRAALPATADKHDPRDRPSCGSHDGRDRSSADYSGHGHPGHDVLPAPDSNLTVRAEQAQ